jgi:hypothetical protein
VKYTCAEKHSSKIANANRFVMIISSNYSTSPVMHPKQNPITLKMKALP